MEVRDYVDTLEMAMYLAVFRLMSVTVAVGPLLDAAAGLARRLRRESEAGPDETVLDRARRAAERASRVVPGSTCLHRSAGSRVWLARRGIEAEVVVGFRDDVPLEGHAWLECQGEGVGDGPSARLFDEDSRGEFHESFRR
ncbi:MAG: lasso peptide biosynthesis B2 protein [Bradymonadaceae bacterium]